MRLGGWDISDDNRLCSPGADPRHSQVLRVDGGASANSLMLQLQADLLQVPVLAFCHVLIFQGKLFSGLGLCLALILASDFHLRCVCCRCRSCGQSTWRPLPSAPPSQQACSCSLMNTAVWRPGQLSCFVVFITYAWVHLLLQFKQLCGTFLVH